MMQLYIYGASGHGMVIEDIAQACGYDKIEFIDDGKNSYPSFDDIKGNTNIPIVIAIGNNQTRARLYSKIKEHGFHLPSLIHPSAIVSKNSQIEEGSVLMPGVVINAASKIGRGVILNTGCIIEHECVIGNFAHISPAVAIAGNVTIGNYTHIGIGSHIIQGIIVGDNTIVGASSNVVKNIGDFKKAYGNPCKEIENIKE